MADFRSVNSEKHTQKRYPSRSPTYCYRLGNRGYWI